MTPALRERAYAKNTSLTDALADALTARGITRPTARLAAQVGMAAFDRANRSWADDPSLSLATLIAQAADEVLALGGT